MTIPDSSLAPAAQFALGMELLGGVEPGGWQRAIALIEAASAAGFGAATERCAIFESMGLGRPPNWDKALDTLQLAAEQGCSAAAEQLKLLAADDAASPAELRRSVSLGSRIGSPQGRILSQRPLIRAIEGFASAGECAWLIGRAAPRIEPAPVYDARGGDAPKQVAERSGGNATFPIVEMDMVVELIRLRIAAAIRVPLPCLEMSQVLHYAVGQEFKPHYDFLDPASDVFRAELARNGQRMATALIYLNDAFEGGETRFPMLDIAYRGRTGDALIFANVGPDGGPDRSTLHAGVPPTAGEKWIFSQWVRDRPPGA